MEPKPETRGRLRPVLLSGLVFPGLGQLVTGHPWRALAFGGSSVVLLVAVVVRVVGETQRLLPEDAVSLLDPALPVPSGGRGPPRQRGVLPVGDARDRRALDRLDARRLGVAAAGASADTIAAGQRTDRAPDAE